MEIETAPLPGFRFDCSVIGRSVNCLFTLATNMKSMVRIALVVALGFLNGCGSGATPLPSLAGTWVFTLTPTASPSDVIQAVGALTELNSHEVLGQLAVTGSGTACGPTAEMSGTVNNTTLLLQLTQSRSTITLKGTATTGLLSSVNASGTYTATTGACLQNGGTGTWSAGLETNTSSK